VEKFPGIVQEQSQCFLDVTVGDHINLRQALMLYDTVYCSLPLAENHDAFLQKQAITEDDLLFLIEKGRLKIVSTQAEERLKIPFLEAASERHPKAIIGRRTAAALLVADIVQTADEYRLARPDLYPAIGELAKVLSVACKVPADELLRLIMWPVEARRASLWPLLERGSKGIAPISLGPFLARQIKRLADKDLELECLVATERVHLGHALGATVFPSKDEPTNYHALMNVMGDALNFFRSFNTRIVTSWIANEDRKAARKTVMPPLPLFEFEPGVPIQEFIDAVKLSSTRKKGRALFGRLAELPEEDRADEIAKLDTELRKRFRHSAIILFETFDTAASIAGLIFGVPYPPLAGLRQIAIQIKEAARGNPIVDKLIQRIEEDLFSGHGNNQEIDFLSRINRVATFKKNRIS
jgi:hypothetical protein